MSDNVRLKTSIDVAHIRAVSRILRDYFKDLSGIIQPGLHIAAVVDTFLAALAKHGARSAVEGFNNFPAPVCVSINHVAAHGIPGGQVLREGDIVSVDTAVVKDGWYSDAAWTYIAGEGDTTKKRLLKAAWQASRAGVLQAAALNRIGDIGAAVEKRAAAYGCTVLEGFTGHGTGFELHEPPNVPFFGEKGTGQPIVPGMVLTVEPIVALGKGRVKTLRDNWTIVTAGGELTAHFEHTVAVFGTYIEVLTLEPELFDTYPEYPPY
jgi:methionyl aminopeptidase